MKYEVFLAIPFDSATRRMYEQIGERLSKELPVEFTLGTQVIGPSQEFVEIETFRRQNAELWDQIRSEILGADVMVADLTNNNPNVHYELGIAITLNKNILRVTGRDLVELGFDVRGLEVARYENEASLYAKLRRYLEMFLKIKSLPLSNSAGPSFIEIPGEHQVHMAKDVVQWMRPSDREFRDGAVVADFKLIDAQADEDWFGIYIRSSKMGPLFGSVLVHVRKNGSVEVATYYPGQPSPNIVKKEKLLDTPLNPNREETLMVDFEGEVLKVTIAGKSYLFSPLIVQSPGEILFAVWNGTAIVRNIRMVSRDTIYWKN